MKLKISAAPCKFKFVAESSEMDKAVSKIVAVVTSQGSSAIKGFLIVVSKTGTALVGYTPDTYIYVVLRSSVSTGFGCIAFNHQTLQGLIKNRGELEFVYEGKEIAFRATKGKYSGTFNAEQFTDEQASVIDAELNRSESQQDVVMPKSVLTALKEGVNLTAVKDVFTSEALLSYMTLSPKGTLSVSSFDKHHFGLYTAAVDAKGMTFKVALPSSHFNMIDRLAESESVKFYVRSESLRIEGDYFAMILPSTQTDEGNYSVISGYLKELDKSTFSCVVETSKLSATVDNLFTLLIAKTSAILDLSNKQGSAMLCLKFGSSSGSAGDAIKVSDLDSIGMSAKIDPRILKDLITLLRSQKSTSLHIVPSRVIRFDCKTELGKVSLVGALAA
jgi:hypothetical protein